MMQELFAQPYFGVLLTIAAYWAGMKIQHKTRLAICNGMLLAVLLVIAVLLVFHIPYESYYQGGALINLFLGPATACMAVTIYSQRRLLAKHWLPVLVGCTVGVVTAMGSILLLCRLFGLDRAMTMSLLPKSVTMPIATVVSQGHGGTTAITVAAVVVTGMLGNLCAPLLVKLFRVKDPIAVGLGIGACSHAMGTAKALELGETEGAMSGLAIGLCGMDGHMIEARKLDDVHGYVGEIVNVNTQPILDVLEKGYIPVISTVGCDNEGNPYNINADTAAARIAASLGAESLISMTDIRGILRDPADESTLIPAIQVSEAPQLIREGIISGGMIPKIECCIEAIRRGVKKVFIIDGRVPHAILIECLTDEGVGTMFY